MRAAGVASLTIALLGLLAAAANGQIVRSFTSRFSTNDSGDIQIIGNTLMTCPPGGTCAAAQDGSAAGAASNNNAYSMVAVDVDIDAATSNSSRAALSLPGGATVLFAGLYWGARSTSPSRNRVKFSTPIAPAYTELLAAHVDVLGSTYHAFADVTALVQAGGNGSYTTANVQAALGTSQHAGWALVVVYRAQGEPARNLTVLDGFANVSQSSGPATIPVTGFTTPVSGPVRTRLGTVAYEGDRGASGDHLEVSGQSIADAINPSSNFFNSTIARLGVHLTAKTPNYTNQLGYDIDVVDASGVLGNGVTSAAITLRTINDSYLPGVVTFATELFAPDFSTTFTKTVTDLNGGLVQPGDTLRYELALANAGQGTASSMVLTDPIPPQSTYVRGTLEILTGPNVGPKTDAAGDDQAELDAVNNRAVFRLGVAATTTTGGTMPPGAATSLRFDVVVGAAPLDGARIANRAIVAFTEATLGTPLAADSTLASVTITNRADLSIAKTGPPTAAPGHTIAYTLIVSNHGPVAATEVTVSDTPPTGVTFVGNAGACATAFPCALGTVPAGQSRTITSTFTVPVGYAGPAIISNAAAVTSTVSDPVAVNNSSTAQTLAPRADLSITKSGPASPSTGAIIYTIVVSNSGPSSALGVTVTDPTPTGLTFVSNAGDCTTAFPCALGSLAAGAQRTIQATFSVPPDHTDAIVNTATVSSSTVDSLTANNSATASTPPEANLSLAKTGPATIAPAETITYTLVVSNAGPSAAAGVVVMDGTPAGLAFVSNTGACTTAFPCTLGTLPAGQSRTITAAYAVAADAAAGAAIDNTATVTTATPDSVSANDTASQSSVVTAPTDNDGDGMPDGWERQAGLDTTRNDAAEDPDADAATNRQELQDGTHPRGRFVYYSPEGSENPFFTTRVLLANGDPVESAHVLVRAQREGAGEEERWTAVPAGARTQVAAADILSAGASFSLVVESDVSLTVEREMSWVSGGAHADELLSETGRTWHFAEGATHSDFQLFYLLQNPGAVEAQVEVTYLLAAPKPPLVRSYALPPRSRVTLWLNQIPDLAGSDVAGVVRSANGVEIAASRSMYRHVGGVPFRSGHTSNGLSAPALEWFLSEGSTGDFFDCFLTFGNAERTAADVQVRYLLASGHTVVRNIVVPPTSRATVWVDAEDARLASTSFGIHVSVTNAVPIAVERAMWWPGPGFAPSFWYEGHASAGVTATAPRWRFAMGDATPGAQTYLLLTNFGSVGGQALLTLAFDDGTISQRILDIAATSRTTLDVAMLAPEAADRTFQILVGSLGSPMPLLVERAIYRSENGVVWSSGSVLVGAGVP